MSESTSHDESAQAHDEAYEEAHKPKVSRVPAPAAKRSMTSWMAPLALVCSLLAAGAAAWGLLKPAPESPTAFKSDDPKATVCKAFKTVSDAVYLQTNRNPPPDLGPAVEGAAMEAIAANARLAMAGGANYLLANLPANTPADLNEEVRSFAADLNSIAMNALAGIANEKPEQADLLHSAEESNKKIAELCK